MGGVAGAPLGAAPVCFRGWMGGLATQGLKRYDLSKSCLKVVTGTLGASSKTCGHMQRLSRSCPQHHGHAQNLSFSRPKLVVNAAEVVLFSSEITGCPKYLP